MRGWVRPRLGGRTLRLLLLALVLAYGALLRFDALTLTYGPVERPGWLRTLQQSRGASSFLRPSTFHWERWEGRYISDPYTYLRYGREMRAFYAAHRREPAFPFATRVFLRLLHDHDTAVSFASGFFSVLAIAATFLLGYLAFSYWVGLGAAAALAIEYDAVTWGVGGWRDDAFACAVVLTACGLVRYLKSPSGVAAVTVGFVLGASLLVRITALSFALPALVWTWLEAGAPRRQHAGRLVAAAAVASLVVGPYLVNCWRAFGDPLYAINVHADVYRAAEGKPEIQQSATTYLREGFAERPWQTLDTALIGMTAYPFGNKWGGFDRWVPGLGRVLAASALLGLVLFLGTPAGRVMLVVLAASLVPYALTWKLIADWRFTAHAYPFFLIAAFVPLWCAAMLLQPSRRSVSAWRPTRRAVALWTAAVVLIAAATWLAVRVLPVRSLAEAVASGDAVSVSAGGRDRILFTRGWSSAVREGNVTARVTNAPVAIVRLPLVPGRPYRLVVRLDPHPRPQPGAQPDLPVVRLSVNDRLLRTVPLEWNPERVGAYIVEVPADVVRERGNRLTIAASHRDGSSAQVRLWHVRVLPLGDQAVNR
ncbi:MAG TPA: glycosyltransferase family 39 protein [Vicinamibacterales bacterium]|nr:glycosyltransferase family 39 protein [Vicinamibacterales bacterium]